MINNTGWVQAGYSVWQEGTLNLTILNLNLTILNPTVRISK